MAQQSLKGNSSLSGVKKRPWARRQLIVNAALQFRMLLPIVVFTVVEVLLLLAFLVYPIHRNASLDPNPVVQALLSERALDIHVRLWPMVGFAAVLAALYTLVLSHWVAGPLYRLQQGLQSMTLGKFQKLRFRDGDELREFEGITHRLARKMETLSAGKVNRISRIESRIARLDLRLETEDVPKRNSSTGTAGLAGGLQPALRVIPGSVRE